MINWTRADLAPQMQINKQINKKIVSTLSDLMNLIVPLKRFRLQYWARQGMRCAQGDRVQPPLPHTPSCSGTLSQGRVITSFKLKVTKPVQTIVRITSATKWVHQFISYIFCDLLWVIIHQYVHGYLVKLRTSSCIVIKHLREILSWIVCFTPRPLYPVGMRPLYPLDRRLG